MEHDAAARRGLNQVGDYLRQQALLMSLASKINYDYTLEQLCNAWHPDFKEPMEVISGNMDILDKLPISDDQKAALRTQATTLAASTGQPYETALERLALTWFMKNNQPTVRRTKQGFRHTKTLPSRLWKSGRKR